MSKNLPPPDTTMATSVLSQRFSMDDERRPSRQERRLQDATPAGSFEHPITDVAPNPRNPRETELHQSEIQKLAHSIRNRGQMHACPVVERDRYFLIFPPDEFPDDAKAIGNARYVQVPGACRRAALILNGSPTIKIEVQNELAASRQTFVDATVGENVDRADLDPIEDARAFGQMVQVYPSVAAVARDRSISDAVIFQKLNLLKLHPEVQAALRVDEPADDGTPQRRRPRLPVREVRNWHKQPAEVQLANLEAWRRRHDPTYTAADPEPEAPKPAVSRTRAAMLRLGPTLVEQARKVRAELSTDELNAYVAELTRDEQEVEEA